MSNALNLNAKEADVQALVEKMSKAKSVVVAEYRGLTVKKTEELRRLLRKEGCEMIVAKNNISRRAAVNSGFIGLDNDLVGPNSVVLSMKDSVIATKILFDFARKNPNLVVKAGVVDGDYFTQDQIKMIAQLPSKQVLLAMLASALYSPLKDLAVGLDMIANKE
ncbi:MAG: 50S ribosomal protein L10 [Tenericutes bacterium HGW-Tenericutes-1]|jgi:large subunit ribosomal protein L10|nr:MAG: 50S ribosomal protein L10 [Tenericutes bacterium HGW-Tenericutes-1]